MDAAGDEPAMWAMSTQTFALTAVATFAMRGKSITPG
jgi:hypothetical protein